MLIAAKQSFVSSSNSKFQYIKFEIYRCVNQVFNPYVQAYVTQLASLFFESDDGDYFVYPDDIACYSENFDQNGESPYKLFTNKRPPTEGGDKWCAFSPNGIFSAYCDLKNPIFNPNVYRIAGFYNGSDTSNYTERRPEDFAIFLSNDPNEWIRYLNVTGYDGPTGNFALYYQGTLSKG